MKKPKQAKPKTRKYRVLYAVTRSEAYEIEARNATEAEELAFSEGEFIDTSGAATSVESYGVEEVTVSRPGDGGRSKQRGAS